jgi:2-phospho-L-lactate guanylyltransferase
MRTAAVLPIKSFGRAKQRLRAAVAQPGRADLAAAMVGDVLAALGRVPGLDDLVVVTAEPRAAAAARTDGAHVVHDPAETGQSDAAALGVAAALARGAERALLVPGDCPALDPREVAALLASATGPADTAGPTPAGRGGTVVIVPDRHGTGTNALLLSPPRAIAPAFGPGSFARHRARAAAAGAAVRIAAAPSLELDVDTPGDLAALRAALDRRPHAAPRTRALLARIAAAA